MVGGEMSTRRTRPARVAGIVGSVVAAGSLVAACGAASTSHAATTTSTTTVTVAYVPLPLFAPLFVAQAKGDFAKEHIRLHLEVVADGQSAITLAATGRVQVVLGGFSAGLFNAIHQGLDVRVVGSMAEEAPGTPANGLVGSITDHVTSLSELAGKRIAVAGGPGSAGAYLTELALAKAHIPLSRVTLVNVNFPSQASALATGGVQAAYMATPFLQSAVASHQGTVLAGAPVGVAVTGVIYGGSFLHTKTAQRFFDALAMGAQALQGSGATSTSNLSIIARATGESLSLLRSEPPNIFSPTLAPPTSVLASMQRVYLANGNLDYTSLLPTSSIVDPSFSASAS
jgi:NitT/TauT family transport system substrate-binding protein